MKKTINKTFNYIGRSLNKLLLLCAELRNRYKFVNLVKKYSNGYYSGYITVSNTDPIF